MSELLGRYQLVEKIAVGGMADVFAAFQWGDGGFVREVIIKRLHRHLVERRGVLEDFCNEAKLLSILAQPGVPRVFEFRCDSGNDWYLAMELVRGWTLSSILDRCDVLGHGRKLPPDAALALVVGLCDVLDEIHRTQDWATNQPLEIVHGDVTPGNVVVTPSGTIRLLDFGISSDESYRLTLRGREKSIRGTLGYIAPEAIAGKGAFDRRADIFVLGILLYELTTGERLYEGDGLAYMNSVLEEKPRTPAEVDGNYPAEMQSVVMRCLQREPSARPATASELADSLRTVASSLGHTIGPGKLREFAQQLGLEPPMPRQPGARPTELSTAPMPPSELSPSSARPSGSAELTPEERDEVLQDLLELAPADSGIAADADTRPTRPFADDALLDSMKSMAAPLPPAPASEPLPARPAPAVASPIPAPRPFTPKAPKPPKSSADEEGGSGAGFYMFVSDEDT